MFSDESSGGTGDTGETDTGTSGSTITGQGLPAPNAPFTSSEFFASSDITGYLSKLYTWSIGIGAALAIFMLTWAGYTYVTSAGNPDAVNQAKEYIIGAILGLLLLILAGLFYKALKSPTKEGAVGSPSATSTINPDLPSQEEIIETTPQPAGDVLPDINPA